jgi:hypothetical protein
LDAIAGTASMKELIQYHGYGTRTGLAYNITIEKVGDWQTLVTNYKEKCKATNDEQIVWMKPETNMHY